MNLLPKSHEEFSHAEYWDAFFKKRGKKTFEWYGEYPELREILTKYIKMKDDILIVGCGNSTLSMSLYDVGYRNIVNIDISHIVIKQMRDINNDMRSDLVYEHMDATQMTYPDEKFSVILDKGTLDALMPDAKEATVSTIDKYFKEITRVLRNGGRYICISLLQEHILRKLLSYFPASGFMFRVAQCHEAELKARADEGSSIPVFVIVATKFTKLSQTVLEIALVDDSPKRLSTTDEMISAILFAQQSALVFNSLYKKNIANVGEISLDLYRPGDKYPRYTVYVLDKPRPRVAKTYATFIVPQGKETDWVFSTKEGRQQVLKSVQRDRLMIATLHRGHEFESWDAVKTELKDCVSNLAPAGLRGKTDIPYLSLGADVGVRNVCYEGKSDFSGPFVIEEVEKDVHDFRRLVFLNNPYVIQSEARLKKAKSRRGKTRKIADLGFLACNHHIYMSAGVNAVIDTREQDEIMVIGLGGGGLCMFLHQCFPTLKITAVEIDNVMLKVATEYFNLVLDDRMRVEIADGIRYIKDVAASETKYKAILFDVDSKDTTVGMSCPPKEFLEISMLKAVASCLTKNGLFILNLVSRDQSLRQKAKANLKSVFQSITCYSIKEEINEIVMCSPKKHNPREWKTKLRLAANDLNKRSIAKKLSSFKELYNVATLLESLSAES